MYLPIGSKLTNKKGEVYTIEQIVNRSFWPWPDRPIPDNAKKENILGSGGFGITYLASCEISDGGIPQVHWFAIKEYFVQKTSERDADGHSVIFNNEEDKKGIESFIKEADRLKDLSHDNIVKVVDVFKSNGTAYYVMQFLEGGSLQDRVAPKGGAVAPMSEAEAVNLMKPMMEAVEYMHSRHLMHCDIKPSNIVLHKNKPILIDFGESLHFNDKGDLTTTHGERGITPNYSSPEQYVGIDKFEPTCDVYALGATLFFLVTGKKPARPTDLSAEYFEKSLRPHGVSDVLFNAIVHAMAFNKQDRTPSVAALMQELGNRKMPSLLPIGYRLNHGVDEYEIIDEGKVCSNHIEYLVYHLHKNDQIGATERVRYKLYEYFVEGTTSRERNYHLQHVSRNGSAYSSFLRMSKEHESYQDFRSFEANGTSYFVHRRRTMPKPSPNLWKKVGYVAGVMALAGSFYWIVDSVNWASIKTMFDRDDIPATAIADSLAADTTRVPSISEVENYSFDVIAKVKNVKVSLLVENLGMYRYTYTGEVNADTIPNGKGTAVFVDASGKTSTYEGSFVNGIAHGDNANFKCTDGSVFVGKIHNFLFVEGKLTLTNGQYFEGKFKDGAPDEANGQWH